MKISQSFFDGFRKISGAKRYVFLAFGLNVVLALILAGSMKSTLQHSMGHSLAGEKMLQSFDDLWYQNFSAKAEGLAKTFHPAVTGIGAVFDGLNKLVTGSPLDYATSVLGLGFFYLLMWTFLSGGFVAVYAAKGERPAFLQSAARFFPRFLILGLMAGVLYVLLFKFVFAWLSDAVEALTRETIDERVHFAYTVVKYLILWFLLISVNLLFDYSKIFTVLTDHRNAFTAPLRAVKVVFGNFGKSYGLYLTIGLLWLCLMLIYWVVAPGAGQSHWVTIFLAFLLGQIYILSRVWIRCLFYAGQISLCAGLLSDKG